MRNAMAVMALLILSTGACSPAEEGTRAEVGSAEIAPAQNANSSLSMRTFVPPGDNAHFLEPAGRGQLRVCRSPNNSVRDAVAITSGTKFSDVGLIDQPPELSGGWWLLWVETTQTVMLAAGEDCTIVEARVVQSEVPSNYSDQRPLTRFDVADHRYFEILSDGENLDRYPALLLMNATAHTDFH